jgi:hypothetical protein
MACASVAQVPSDSTRKKTRTGKAIQQGIGLISANPSTPTVNQESSEAFKVYEGKIIRKVVIDFIGFEKSIYDSTKKTKKIITDVANALHTPTKEKVIRNHLFFRANDQLNPYLLGDNERYLRDQNFILDSRIVVVPTGSEDSVDVVVITRDVFSLGISLGGSPPANTKFSVYDVNLAGQGQRLQLGGVVDVNRDPMFGFSGLYRKSSWLGTLTSIEFGYTQVNEGRSIGRENEFAYFARVSRPLVSPYTRMAGGMEVSKNWSKNVFNEPDSIFLDYEYNLVDFWAGYNIGIHKEASNRRRHFVAVRYFDGKYLDRPEQPEYGEALEYNSLQGALAEFTFYNMDFYKTQYVFGFGRTEDVPSGVRASVSAGYLNVLGVERPYGAVKSAYRGASKKGSFYEVGFEAGTYFREGFEDTSIKWTLAYFTRAFNLGNYKMRTLLRLSGSTLSNHQTNNYVKMDRNSIHGFSADSLLGTQQLTVNIETILYTPWQVLGFRFAPFFGIDMARQDCLFCDDELWKNLYGLNVGLRMRNENLIFGTIEIRISYIPDNGFGESRSYFDFRQNVRLKSSPGFVNPPTLVRN